MRKQEIERVTRQTTLHDELESMLHVVWECERKAREPKRYSEEWWAWLLSSTRER